MLGTFEKIAYISMILLIEVEQFKQAFIYVQYCIGLLSYNDMYELVKN